MLTKEAKSHSKAAHRKSSRRYYKKYRLIILAKAKAARDANPQKRRAEHVASYARHGSKRRLYARTYAKTHKAEKAVYMANYYIDVVKPRRHYWRMQDREE